MKVNEQAVDILAFGAHADDVEIGMGGTIAKYAEKGKRIVICDLTHAELSSNGTVELRLEEARKAADILGASERITLDIPDRGIYINENHLKKVVEVIRTYRPNVIFAPYEKDRHPDHGNASRLITEAYFSSGIRKFHRELDAHKPQHLYYYMINGFHRPDFMVNIEGYMDKKVDSLRAYTSQFIQASGVATPLTKGYIESVEARETMMGKEVGSLHAEGFFTHTPITLHHDLLGE
ncbi:bacillithiol biosynthesis deacetylase BshB1 [Rossellomorea marisflavi]|uniref:bacillithiol biosynthesis deacetylase BshB1 n=1 Tax=Rossellomorea marisflavi TaxID=189381 RepID=UPI00064F980C|nr:bacillithiol biosynthesis deacetylase BshB1 [Rossellomorea marisflavi]KML01483.1 deacetylase [Rossellomorea marisflavi]